MTLLTLEVGRMNSLTKSFTAFYFIFLHNVNLVAFSFIFFLSLFLTGPSLTLVLPGRGWYKLSPIKTLMSYLVLLQLLQLSNLCPLCLKSVYENKKKRRKK